MRELDLSLLKKREPAPRYYVPEGVSISYVDPDSDWKAPQRDHGDKELIDGPVGTLLGIIGFIFIALPIAGVIGWFCGGIAGIAGLILLALIMMVL